MGILCGQGLELFVLPFRHRAALVLKDEVRAADDDLFVVDLAGDAVRNDVLHLGMIFLVVQPALSGFFHDGVRHRVRIVLFQTGRQTEHFLLAVAAEGNDLRDGRRGVGERAGLVEDDGVRVRDRFEEASALDGDMMHAALAHRGEHGNRHRQLQRAGEVHHQHGEHLRHVACDEIRQRRAAQRVGHEPVGQTGSLVLGGGFQLFGFLDHVDDAVIAAAAHCLFHADDAFALLRDRPGVDRAAGPLRHGHRFAGHGRLIDHRLAGDDFAVQRDEVARADDDFVARLDLADRDKNFRLAGLFPDLVDIQRHRAREIGHGLLVRPLLQNLAEPQHEHHGACGGKVAAHHRDGDGCRVEHGDGELPVPEGFQPFPDIFHGAEQRDRRRDRNRQEQPVEHAAADREDQLVFKLAVQRAGCVLRHKLHCLGPLERKGRQRLHHSGAAVLIGDNGVLRPVEDLDVHHTGHGAQIVFQHIRLAQRHRAARQMDADAPSGFM